MFLSRAGLDISRIAQQQSLRLESDARGRGLERDYHSNPEDGETREAYIAHLRRSGDHGAAARVHLRKEIDDFHKHQDDAIHHNTREWKERHNKKSWEHGRKSTQAFGRMLDAASVLHKKAQDHGVEPYHLVPPRKDEPVGHHIGRLSRFHGEGFLGPKDPDRATWGGGDISMFDDEKSAHGFASGMKHYHPHLDTEVKQHSETPGHWHVYYKPKKEA